MTPAWLKFDMAGRALTTAIYLVQEAGVRPEIVNDLVNCKVALERQRRDV